MNSKQTRAKALDRIRQTALFALSTVLAVLVASASGGTASAQYQDCPSMHQCLVGCAGKLLSGASDDAFYSCNDKCLEVDRCVEGRPGQTRAMKNARACAKLHGCIVNCAQYSLSGATNDQLDACNERCLNKGSACDPQVAAASAPPKKQQPAKNQQNNNQQTNNNQQNNNQQGYQQQPNNNQQNNNQQGYQQQPNKNQQNNNQQGYQQQANNNQQNNNQQPQGTPLVAVVLRDLGVRSVSELSGAVLCLLNDQTGQTVQRYFKARGLEFTVKPVSKFGNMRTYQAGACDVTFVPQQAARATLNSLKRPNAHMTLPEVIR